MRRAPVAFTNPARRLLWLSLGPFRPTVPVLVLIGGFIALFPSLPVVSVLIGLAASYCAPTVPAPGASLAPIAPPPPVYINPVVVARYLAPPRPAPTPIFHPDPPTPPPAVDLMTATPVLVMPPAKPKKKSSPHPATHTPPPVVSPPLVETSSGENYDALLAAYFPAAAVPRAKAIMHCESGGRAAAHNFSTVTKDNSWGLFQINIYGPLAANRPSGDWLSDPAHNIQYAAQMYQSDGFAPWSCAKKLGLL